MILGGSMYGASLGMTGDFRSDDDDVSTPESADHCRGADLTELLLPQLFGFELKANL